MDLLELNRLLEMEKIAHNWTGFQRRPNQANFLIGTAQLTDTSGVFLPAVTLEIEVKPPVVVDRTVLLFSLRKRMLQTRCRIYQLEVCPGDKRSHNGDPVIYGPHEHLLEDEVHPVAGKGVNYDDWSGSFKWFLQRINVRDFEVDRPW